MQSESVYYTKPLKNAEHNRLYEYFPKELFKLKDYKNLYDCIAYLQADIMKDPIMADAMMYYIMFLNTIGVDDKNILSVPYSQDDIEALTRFLDYDTKYILSDDSSKAIVSGLYVILGMKKKYDEAKKYALEINGEQNYQRILKASKELESKSQAFNKEKEALEKQVSSLSKKLDERNKDIEMLKKELKEIKQQLANTEDNNKEVAALRDAVYEFSKSEEDKNKEAAVTISTEEKEDVIKDYKVTIFGGTDGWVVKMKNELPGIKFFGISSLNSDITSAKKSDLILINASQFSHAYSYKVMSFIKKHNLKFEYLTKFNKDGVVSEIYDKLINHKQ